MTTPRKTAEELEEARIGLLTLISAMIGLVAGLISFAPYHLIGFLTNLFFYQRFDKNAKGQDSG